MIVFLIFLIIGTLFGIFYAALGDEIGDIYNVDRGRDTEKIRHLKDMPIPLRLERFWHRFAGVFIGWMLMWALLDKRIAAFSDNPHFTELGFPDLILFLLAYIGINGRLPTVAHSLQDWLPKRS